MALKIVKVCGGTKEEVLSKKFNIFIGISLGNKWFTEEHLKEYVSWALKDTKDNVLIFVADKIHAVNYQVRNGQTPENSLRGALKEGDKRLLLVKKIVEGLSQKKRAKIVVLRWEDLENSEHKNRVEFFYKKFRDDKKFKEEIFNVVKIAVSWKFDEKNLNRLAEYVLDELSEILMTFKYKKIEYGCYPYPMDSKIAEFVEKIQNEEIFPEIKNWFKFKNMVCVQLEPDK